MAASENFSQEGKSTNCKCAVCGIKQVSRKKIGRKFCTQDTGDFVLVQSTYFILSLEGGLTLLSRLNSILEFLNLSAIIY